MVIIMQSANLLSRVPSVFENGVEDFAVGEQEGTEYGQVLTQLNLLQHNA